MNTALLTAMAWLILSGYPPRLFAQQAQALPFRLAGKLIIISANIDGRPGNFILDTGTPNLVLNSRYYFGRPSGERMYNVLGKAVPSEVRYSNLSLGEHTSNNVQAEVVRLVQLETAKGIPIHGLIGSRVLQPFEILVDLDRQLLTLIPTDKKGNVDYRYPIPPVDTLSFRRNVGLPQITAVVGSVRLKLLLDTGAEVNIINGSWQKKLRPHLVAHQPGSIRVVSFGPDRVNKRVYQLGTIAVGGRRHASFRFMFCAMSALNSVVSGTYLDGLAGYDILGARRFAINFRKGLIYRWQKERPERILVGGGTSH